MRNSHSPPLIHRECVDQLGSEDTYVNKPRWPQRMATRAFVTSVAVVLSGWLLVSCSDGAVAAENANPEVVVDGTTCIYDGPTKIEHGGIEFTLINESVIPMQTAALLYDDPADYRAALDSLPVGTDADVTDTEVPGIGDQLAPGLRFGFVLNVEPGQQAATLTLLDIGEYILMCADNHPGQGTPDHIWVAATFEIVP
jgi:hypothetical protein